MPDPMEMVKPVVGPAAACMPLECPDPDGPYKPLGICDFMLNMALGSIAPALPFLEILENPLKIPTDLPDLPDKLPTLPFEPTLKDMPPIPIPGFGLEVGGLELPSFELALDMGLALGNLVVGILTIPLDMIKGLCIFEIPDLSFEGILELVLGNFAANLELDLELLPQLGLLDLAICIIAIILLPITLILAAFPPLDEDSTPPAPPGYPTAKTQEELDEMTGANMSDEEKRAKAEEVLKKLVDQENAKKRAQRQRAMDATGEQKASYKKWKPGIGDDFYG